jgi:hypothetical protein
MRPHLLLSALTLCTLAGCKHDADIAPQCYSGVVLGESCNDGTLIQVDGQYSIGQPVTPRLNYLSDVPASDSIGSTNLIASVESLPPTLKRGQRIYFAYQNDPMRQRALRQCIVFGPLPIPHLVLSNVSATPCVLP